MRKPFEEEYPQTQEFDDPRYREQYAKFGLKGHNGLDYATPSGTRIIAPHDGKIIEATFDSQGYGIYLKIENSIEGSVLAHLREFRVGVGDGIKEGELVGYSDNSGNSTGPHLHWGYYRFPRDRKNGFAGFIDQTPYIGTGKPNLDLQAELDKTRKERDDNHDDRMALYEELGFEGDFNRTIAVTEIRQLKEIAKKSGEKDEELKALRQELQELREELRIAKEKIVELQKTTQQQQVATDIVSFQIDTTIDKTNDIEKKIDATVKDEPTWWENIVKSLARWLDRR